MNVILFLHSWVRWLVLLVGLAALIKLVIVLARRGTFDSMARGLTSAFAGLLDLNVLLGLILLVWKGLAEGSLFDFSNALARSRWEHLFVMIFALAAAHLPARWKSQDDAPRTRKTLLAVVAALLLVVMGVFTLVGNRWGFRGL